MLGREPSVGARLIAVQWLVSAGDVEAARGVLAEVPSNLQGAPLTLRVQRYAVAAELAFAAGDRAAGLRAVKRGFGILAEHRARLGSVDSVAAAAVHAVGLNWTDVAAARATGRASAVFDAVERGRATFAGAARVTPRRTPSRRSCWRPRAPCWPAPGSCPSTPTRQPRRSGPSSTAGRARCRTGCASAPGSGRATPRWRTR
ncbi:hypothetical protein GCM10025864_04990 [Luteimicrobium album]|uniref:Uncharacterized protein n=1 Tax=Luteimicrobium album TaxID=1054550 RepID=A0ABQ6HYX9_9MICO|nr:hypothetical protein [Luteimicrobium album]GMA22740.1 hypothetical protein GCM10025864_04990 [Luteimicrobium album]